MTPYLQLDEVRPQREKWEKFEARLEVSAAERPRVRLAFLVTQHLQRRKFPQRRETPERVGVPLESSVIEGLHILPAPSGAWPHAAVSASRLVLRVVWCPADG